MEEQSIRLDPRGIRPQERERDPLSGETVNVRSHSGGSIGFRGKDYKPDKKTGIIHDLPIEAVQAVESATFWTNGKPMQMKCDIVKDGG